MSKVTTIIEIVNEGNPLVVHADFEIIREYDEFNSPGWEIEIAKVWNIWLRVGDKIDVDITYNILRNTDAFESIKAQLIEDYSDEILEHRKRGIAA